MTRMVPSLAALALCFASALAAPADAADPPRFDGDWEGPLKINDALTLKVVFHVTKGDDGKLSATMDSPDQGALGIKADQVALDKLSASLTVPSLQGKYKGTLSADSSTIDGTWTQVGRDLPLKLARFKPGAAAKPDQMWAGKLKIGGVIELRLVLNLFAKPGGGFTATLDSPDQGANGLKVDEVALGKDKLTFSVKLISGEFTGAIKPGGDEAEGEWKQLGNTSPLTLKKTDKVEEARRPQMPKKPYPYREVEVSYPNKSAGISLAGTLTLPPGPGPFPAVVLITGSGAQDRDESLMGHKPFLVLADYLTRRGVAVLRSDDRGVGGSTGDHTKATSADFATDAEAAVAFLKAQKGINPAKIGLMGHSEGGLIAPIVAAKDPKGVAFLVLLAGPGVPGDEILALQSVLMMKAAGMDAKTVDESSAVAKKMYAAIRTEKDEAAAQKALEAIAKASLATLSPDDLKKLGPDPMAAVQAQFKTLQSPWFRYFLTYDPRPTLAKVKCPVLAINGEKDLQVAPGQNLLEIAKALKTAGNRDVTTRELPGLNHLFQSSKTGSIAEYATIEETFNPEALKLIGDWITSRK